MQIYEVGEHRGEPYCALELCEGGLVSVVAFHPDSKLLATGGSKGTIALWNCPKVGVQVPLATLTGDRPLGMSETAALRFSDDGDWLLSAHQRWDLREGQTVSHPTKLPNFPKEVVRVAVSDEGRWVAVADKKFVVHLWDVDAGANPAPFQLEGHGSQIRWLGFSSGGRWLVTSGNDNTARLWDLSEANPADDPVVLRGHEDKITAANISPSGRWLATGSIDNTIRLWDLWSAQPENPLRVLRGHSAGIAALDFSRENTLVSVSLDRGVRQWTIGNGLATSLVHWQNGLTNLGRTSTNENWLVVASRQQGRVDAWDLRTPTPCQLHELAAGEGVPTATLQSPQRRWLLTRTPNKILRWDLQGDKPVATAEVIGKVGRLAPGIEQTSSYPISADGRWLVTLVQTMRRASSAKVWDLSKNPAEVVSTIRLGRRTPDQFVSISPDGKWITTVHGENLSLWGWDGNTRSESPLVELAGHRAVSFSRDGRWLATSSMVGKICLFDLTQKDVSASKLSLDTDTLRITHLRFTEDSRRMIVAGVDNFIRVWRLDAPSMPPEVLTVGGATVQRVVSSGDGRWLAVGSMKTVYVWDTHADDIPASRLVIHNVNPLLTGLALRSEPLAVIVSTSNGETKSFDLSIESALALANQRTRREWTDEEREQFRLPPRE